MTGEQATSLEERLRSHGRVFGNYADGALELREIPLRAGFRIWQKNMTAMADEVEQMRRQLLQLRGLANEWKTAQVC